MPGGRGELIQEGALTILNDCYNANPQSFRAAIATAAALRGKRRLVFVAGTMRELGEDSARAALGGCRRAGGAAARPSGGGRGFRSGAGASRRRAGRAADHGGRSVDAGTAADSPSQGDEIVVLKASRGVALERILPALAARAKHPGAPPAPLRSR